MVFEDAKVCVRSYRINRGWSQMERKQMSCSRKTGSVGVVLLAAVSLASTPGCATKAGTGALIGGAAGAGIGAIIGHNSHDRAGSGALIGGAVGAIGGAIVGNEMDKSD